MADSSTRFDPDPMQLDLFSHSRDVMLRNDLLAALKSRDVAAGRHALAALAAEFSTDAVLDPARRLLDRLAAEISPFATHAEAVRAVMQLEHHTRKDAIAVFGAAQADSWLRPAWSALARAAEGLPFRADAPDAHPAGLYLRAADPGAAAHHVSGIAAWRRIPRLLAWAAEASFHLHGLDQAWPLLAELAWLDSGLFAGLAGRLPAPALARLVQQYEREFAASPTDHAWFPAWTLIAHPELRTVLQGAATPQQSAPERACRMIGELLTLERQGRHHEVVEHRQRLRALNPELFTCYMQTRS